MEASYLNNKNDGNFVWLKKGVSGRIICINVIPHVRSNGLGDRDTLSKIMAWFFLGDGWIASCSARHGSDSFFCFSFYETY